MTDYVLGLDLGPNSCGWALIEAKLTEANGHRTHEPVGFLDTSAAGHPPVGVRVFEEGLANFGSSKEASRAQNRRMARSMRRNHQRRNARRLRVRKLLQGAGLLPVDVGQVDEVMARDPYQLRARALDAPLDRFDLGRALFHLGQRRGFKSNRKSQKSKEDSDMLKSIGELERAMDAAGTRTLGEYLFTLNGGAQARAVSSIRLRGRHTRRDMYELEFDAIVEAQRSHHRGALTDDLVAELREAIFSQRDFAISKGRRCSAPPRANLHRAPGLKACPLEPAERRCPLGTWEAQQFRLLKTLNDLTISEHFEPDRRLTDEERNALLEALGRKKTVKFDELRKVLARLGRDPNARFNLERGERSGIQGNEIDAALAAKFRAKRWKSLEPGDRERFRALLTDEEDERIVEREFRSAGLDGKAAKALAQWSPPDSFVAYSRKALREILPHLEDGLSEYEAVARAYPERAEQPTFGQLPYLGSAALPDELREITNPIVRRCLGEARKVVNAIIREHGRPARIVVELAREMKAGPKERSKYSKRIREREKVRKAAAAAVAQLGGNPWSRDDIARYQLWREQGEACPYTGEAIPQSELFGSGYWEVDHILPRWKSGDDSYMNKVLTSRRANLEKGNRTPAEWLGADSEAYREMVARVERMCDRNGLPAPRVERFKQAQSIAPDAFVERQLNDTRYITRAVVRYLSLLYPASERTGEKAVQSSRGGLTAELRRRWGLVGILDPFTDIDGEPMNTAEHSGRAKVRDDHRHHAVDAIVVALSSRATLKRYQDQWREHGEGANRQPSAPDSKFPAPWPSLREESREYLRAVNVSHRVQRRVRGAHHKETFYGPATRAAGAGNGRFVTTKRLDQLTGKMVDGIRDRAVRERIVVRLRERGWREEGGNLRTQLGEWWTDPPLEAPSGAVIHRVRLEIASGHAVALGHRYALPAGNHHLLLVRGSGGRGMLGCVVPRATAVERVRRLKLPPVERRRTDGDRFVASLSRKESVLLYSEACPGGLLCVIQKLSGPAELSATGIDMSVRHARDARVETDSKPVVRLKSYGKLEALRLRKVQVDPLGRISPAGD